MISGDRGRLFDFTKSFVHLGSFATFLLGSTSGSKSRVRKEAQQVGTLKISQEANDMPLQIKTTLLKAVPVNLVFHGSGHYSGDRVDLKAIELL